MRTLIALAFCAAALSAAEGPTPTKVFETQLRGLEREFIPLVEAMPADKFDFAPKDGAFNGVRTFASQAKHIAFVMYEVSAALIGEKNPSATGQNENGPDNIQTKEDVVNYVKGSVTYAHKAIATLTSANLLEEVQNPFNPKGKLTRLAAASEIISHTFDHYGQMVVYLRMNGVIPPASR